jgi:tRNA U34 5-carboxymethylaminomethyl modifying GTPase MnmE/TrmE
VILADTAGIRQTKDAIEQEGIAMAKERYVVCAVPTNFVKALTN